MFDLIATPLVTRTREDEMEEARLREELKTIDMNIKKIKKTVCIVVIHICVFL